MIIAVLILIAAVAFAASPLFIDTFAGIDPSLYPVPQVDPPVQPEGYAFSIWGLIYMWLVAHAAFGVFNRSDDPAWRPSRLWLLASLVAGIPWLWVAERSAPGATALIFLMLGLALAALMRTPDLPDRWLLLAPVAIYAGWLSAAAFVALGLFGAGFGLGLGEVGWAVVAVLLATLMAALVQTRLRRAPEYGLTVAWALVAIVVKNAGTQPLVAVIAGLAALLMAGLAWSSRHSAQVPAPVARSDRVA
jgi:hypothetical protein